MKGQATQEFLLPPMITADGAKHFLMVVISLRSSVQVSNIYKFLCKQVYSPVFIPENPHEK